MNENKKSTIWEFFVNNHKFTYIIIMCVTIFGLFAMRSMPRESSPEIQIPVASIITVYPGANAQDVEELVTTPIEDRLSSLEDLEEFTSVSRNGISSITVQFDIDADPDEKIADLRTKVDEAKLDLPADAQDPMVREIQFSDVPIVNLAISGPFSSEELKGYAEEIEDRIQSVSGVTSINVIGIQEREIQVVVNKTQLDSYGLSLAQVTSAISTANANIPTGVIQSDNANYTVRFAGRIDSADDIRYIPITKLEDTVIVVEDVAKVVDGLSAQNSVSRLSLLGEEAQNSITLMIFKKSGGNIIEIVDEVKKQIEDLQKNILQDSLDIEIVQDNAQMIQKDLRSLGMNGVQTIIIIFLLILFFLGWKEAILAGLSIPLTFLIGFIILSYLGYTFNFLTLFSLILSLGVLVDAAIVITEGIYVHLNSGKNPREAAIATIREFRLPLISGVLTTVFAFLPMMLTSGIIGKFTETIPVTVTSVLVGSLIVALGFVTTLGSRFLKKKDNTTVTTIKVSKKQKAIDSLYGWYEKVLRSYINKKSKRRALTFALIFGFIGSVALLPLGLLKVNMFPSADYEIFYIDIEKPIGTILEQTNDAIIPIEQMLLEDTRIDSFVVNVGSSAGAGSGSSMTDLGSTHVGNILVKLKPIGDERKEKSYTILDEYTEKLKNYELAKVEVWQETSGPPSGAPVEISIYGEDIAELENLAIQFENLLSSIPNTRNIQSNFQDTPGEFVINIDRVKAELYGINTMDVARILRNAVSGIDATVLRKDGEDIDVLVKYDLNPNSDDKTINKVSLDTLTSLTIATREGDIPLSAFTYSTLENNRYQIRHIDGDRVVGVTSEITEGVTAQQIFAQVEKRMNEINIPEGYRVQLGGELDDINESFTDMFRAMFLAIFLIAALLVWQFKSFRQPLFILTTIPLALIGVLPGLTIIGLPLSFPGVIGVVALAGIVVNNAIILVDRINENRRNGMEKEQAVEEAAKARLQPILLTTITTIAGVLPLAISDETWGPLAYSIIFGLIFSTVLTLLVIPLLYRRYGERVIE